jgi:4-amino-4-deoxy-L-arabinose transferase-like glycosyltransferase
MKPYSLNSAVGALLILLGILVPSFVLIESLRSIPADLADPLLMGATLLRIGLVFLGLLILGLSRMSLWTAIGTPEKGKAGVSSKLDLAILGLLLLTASLLRFYDLNAGLWHDEVLTYVNYARLPFGEIITTYADQNQHFLYTLLAHASLSLFGEAAWSLRLPAALFGIASIWALYLLGRVASTDREALLSAALLAFSYHHIWFSQNARGYIGLLFWTLLASWLFLRGLHDERRSGLWVLYAAAAALGVYTNTAMVFVIVSHFIIYLYRLVTQRKTPVAHRWSGFYLGFCLAGFLTLFLHALVLPQMIQGLVGEESTVAAWKHPLWALWEFAHAIQLGFAGSLVALAAFLVFGLGLWSFARTSPVMIALLIMPAFLCAAVVVGMGHHVWPRLFFFSFGFAALIVIRGTMVLGKNMTRLFNLETRKALYIGTAFSTGLILVSALGISRAYAPKQDFQGALDFVEAAKRPGDAIATVGLATFTYRNFYKRDWKEVKNLNDLNSARSHAKRIWLLYTFPTHVSAVHPEIMATVESDFHIIKRFPGTVGDGTIFVARSNGTHP